MKKLITYNLGIANAYLIPCANEGYIAFDTGSLCDKNEFVQILYKHHISASEIKLIVISHEHNDHFVNAQNMKELTGAPILCHAEAAHILREALDIPLYPRNKAGQWIVSHMDLADLPEIHIPKIEPDIIIDKEYDLSSYGLEAKLIPTSGHSKGSISLVTSNREAFVGDLLVAEKPGTQYPACIAYFTSYDNLDESNKNIYHSCQQLLSEADIFYSGHGGPFTKEEIITALATDKQ